MVKKREEPLVCKGFKDLPPYSTRCDTLYSAVKRERQTIFLHEDTGYRL